MWLDAQHDAELLAGLTYLRNGRTADIQDQVGAIRVGGIGGCHGPSDYRRRSDRIQAYAKRHDTSDEIERPAAAGIVDIVFTHDTPAGVHFGRHRQGAVYTSEAAGLDVLLTRVWPRVSSFGHHHTRVNAEDSCVHCSLVRFWWRIPILGSKIPEMGTKKLKNNSRAPVASGVADALFTKVQQRVLAVLFGNPARSFYANELIALAASGSGAVQRELAQLEAAELVTVKRVGNQKHYQANASAPIYEELRGLVLKTSGLVDVLRAALAPLAAQIDQSFVYGSVAKGKDTAKSDVDLMVISEQIAYADLFAALEPAMNRLQRTVNPTMYSRMEIHQRILDGNAFVKRVLAQPKLWVIGESRDLAA